MEIERIDENTVKLYLSYVDIEKRGYTREEVWSDHSKGEELFWDMMDEIHEHVDFVVEGPLWIQVHAKTNGVEVIITKAVTDNEQLSGFPFSNDGEKKPGSELYEEETFESIEDLLGTNPKEEWTENIFAFKDFEDVIQITSRMQNFEAKTSLYAYDSIYYLHVLYDLDHMTNKEKTNMFSVLSEFAKPADLTIHILKEYGSIVFEENVFGQIETYFH